MNKRLLITGATGLIGKHIVTELCEQGAHVKAISTDKNKAESFFKNYLTVETFDWSDYSYPENLSKLLEDTDAIINLAGANVGKHRWTGDYKRIIYKSRIETTRLLVKAINLCTRKPSCLINASAVGIYGFRGDEILNENSTTGNDFLAKVCEDWEAEALKAINDNVRVVLIRGGIVLDGEEGALKDLITPFKLFAGGHLGNGKQWFSWIHIDDIIKLYIYALENNNMQGAFNGTSPNPVTNGSLAKIIAQILKRPSFFHVPGFVLRLAVGEFAENLITGQRVYPEKTIQAGFNFKFQNIKEALENILNNK
jgi:uncharacterized protein